MASLVFGQMTLFIAPVEFKLMRSYFGSTCWMCLTALSGLLVTVGVTFILMEESFKNEYFHIGLGATVYVAGLFISDLFRQFLYTQKKQRLSLIYTSIGCSVSFVLLLLIASTGSNHLLYQYAYYCLAAGLFVAIALNRSCFKYFFQERKASLPYTVKRFIEFSQQGKLAAAGIGVTWLQNQSITPLLMFTMGPKAVGIYNLARMVFSPVTIINTGLARNALPQSRSIFISHGIEDLRRVLKGHAKTSMKIAFSYVLATIAVVVLNETFGFIPHNSQFLPAVVSTGIVMLLTNYRFWISQNYIVRMQFSTLLRIGVVASFIAVTFMLVTGNVFGSLVIVIFAAALGEIYQIWTLSRGLSSNIVKEETS